MTSTNEETLSCCTPTPPADEAAVETSTELLDEIKAEEIPEDVAALRAAGFKLLLETGEAVTVDDLIDATDVASERVAEILESVQARGRVEFDDDGRLIGIAGLSLTPSRHQITIGDEVRFAWCALDAVGILGALTATGSVQSTDPQTGETINIDFTDGTPDGDTHLFILGGYTEGNVREDWCPRVNFFATRQAADAWVGENCVEGDVVAVTEVAPQAAEMWRPVVDGAAPQVC